MPKQPWGAADKDSGGPVSELYRASAVALSNLQHFMMRRAEDVRYLRIVPRGEAEWLAILAITSEDGTPMVAFGHGEEWIDALRALNASVSAGKWKDDKFAR